MTNPVQPYGPKPRSDRRPVRMFMALDGEAVGKSSNLSVSGVFVETDRRPTIDSVHELSLAWGDFVYPCAVRIVRHADDGIGLAFVAPDTFFLRAVGEIMAESPTPA